jgi:hypothetical protein
MKFTKLVISTVLLGLSFFSFSAQADENYKKRLPLNNVAKISSVEAIGLDKDSSMTYITDATRIYFKYKYSTGKVGAAYVIVPVNSEKIRNLIVMLDGSSFFWIKDKHKSFKGEDLYRAVFVLKDYRIVYTDQSFFDWQTSLKQTFSGEFELVKE